ncbi:ABC transporter, ATPase subunit [uncultured delta proteobacterium]|uniref:ABC transporter, ATPase subunit n=1 Tax=uncultured delta proteobacterium TaxID=34034 RepID=A0A212KDP4_9DELT|nr:ABC transporter, ATPase subunit [uncultured delta proteobacterium]
MIVTASSLFFRHPGAEDDTLKDVTFSIREGELLCLLGVNGSGKSTLLALLAGLFSQRAGELSVAGNELPREAFKLRGRIALVPQDPDVYILGSLVEEDLLLALDRDDTAGRERALGFARIFGLEHALNQPVHTLSHGQKRKLCLASALAARPEILLLDEPFAGLDHPSSMAMREALARNKAAKLTQVVVGHDLDLMADLADSFMLMHSGEVVAAGNKETVFPRLLAAGVRPPCSWFTGGGPAWL